MVSPNRTRDRGSRTMFLETIQIAARLGREEYVRIFADHSLHMKQKIATHDYTADDQAYERVTKIIKRK